MQLARAPNRKWLSGNAKGVGLPCQGSTGACSSITPSFSSTYHISSSTYLALCLEASLIHSLLSSEANTLYLGSVLCHFFPFLPSLVSPDPPPFSISQSFNPLPKENSQITWNFICPWHGPHGCTVRDPWCYPRYCHNTSGHKHLADVHIWALPLPGCVAFDKCLMSRCLSSLIFKIKLG